MVAWSNCLSQLNLPHKLYIEPQYRYVNSEKRSDILVFDPDSGADIELDVSLAHAWCLISVKAVSREEVAAMKQEEKRLSIIPLFSNILAVGANRQHGIEQAGKECKR